MPKFKGSCGCYNRNDAREIGLVPAIVWNDILDRSEQFDTNPMWYDQKDAAERLGISDSSIGRAVEKLVSCGRITKRRGYRPGTTISTTWITIVEEEGGQEGSRNPDLTVPRNPDLTIPIYKDTNNKDTNNETAISLNPNTVLSALKRTFKQAGYATTGGKALRDKATSFVADISDSELTLDSIVDSAKAYLNNDYYTNKSLMNFMNAKVFAYNIGQKKQEDEGIVRYGE